MEKKKYKLIKEEGTSLFRLVAMRDFSDVNRGNNGGLVEGERNLSHNGDCWVYGNARVSGNAWVYGNAQVYGDARVSGDAQVYGDARVSGNAQVYGDARVSGDAQVYGNATKSPIVVTGLRWTVTITDHEMAIGCQHHDISRWLKFTDRQIAAMDRHATQFWCDHKETLKTIFATTGRPFAKSEAEQSA